MTGWLAPGCYKKHDFTTNKSNYILGFIRKIMTGKAGRVVVCHEVLVKSHLEIYVHFPVTPVQE